MDNNEFLKKTNYYIKIAAILWICALILVVMSIDIMLSTKDIFAAKFELILSVAFIIGGMIAYNMMPSGTELPQPTSGDSQTAYEPTLPEKDEMSYSRPEDQKMADILNATVEKATSSGPLSEVYKCIDECKSAIDEWRPDENNEINRSHWDEHLHKIRFFITDREDLRKKGTHVRTYGDPKEFDSM